MGLFVRDGFDPDAWAYIQAVETADGQPLEVGVRRAIGRFVRGCKDDGIWNAIKASCILTGARTLSGALVPLVGTAPTNNNFVSGDYNRITGLKGDGSSKYLDSNRNNNADPQNSKHLSVYATNIGTNTTTWNTYIGALPDSGAGRSDIELTGSGGTINGYVNQAVNTSASRPATTGFIGAQRSDGSNQTTRVGGVNTSAALSSTTPYNGNIYVFARTLNGAANQHINARLSFYSIGESLDLALLDTRVSQLMTNINNALS